MSGRLPGYTLSFDDGLLVSEPISLSGSASQTNHGRDLSWFFQGMLIANRFAAGLCNGKVLKDQGSRSLQILNLCNGKLVEGDA